MEKKSKKVIAGSVTGVMMLLGGADAVTYTGPELASQVVTVASERVSIEQKGNVVEAEMPWKGEEGLTIKYNLGAPSLGEMFSDNRNEGVIAEKVDFHESEGFKIDILLEEKPSTNKFCYQIEGYENYDFFYQPPLTPEEIAEGDYRPPEIVGSYAVYHKTLKNHRVGGENYATGKVMHIPFPYVWEVNDEANTKQRAEDLTYKDGELCVTVQQDFLDNATYPVRIDPTFGYTSEPATLNNTNADVINTTYFSAPEDGNINQLSAWMKVGAGDFQAGIYDSSDNLLTNSTTNSDTAGVSTLENVTLSYSITNGTSYGLSFFIDANSTNRGGVKYDLTTGYEAYRATGFSFPNWEDPVSWDIDYTDQRAFGIYATYTASSQDHITEIDGGVIEIDGGVYEID